jgi:hypothetical protein
VTLAEGRLTEAIVWITDAQSPDFVPVLSRGKHKSPRRGACFMEFASYLAGERWSDHPACTHPLLAQLARLVNDHTSDARRRRLAGLVPSVVGLTGDDVRIDLRLALRAATTALPVVAEERQRSMAVTVLTANRFLAALAGRPADHLEQPSAHALAQVPHATRWAREHVEGFPVSLRSFRTRGTRAAVLFAVDGIAHACIEDTDGLLCDLLTAAIDDCAELVKAATPGRPVTVDLLDWA